MDLGQFKIDLGEKMTDENALETLSSLESHWMKEGRNHLQAITARFAEPFPYTPRGHPNPHRTTTAHIWRNSTNSHGAKT